MNLRNEKHSRHWRATLHEIIYGTRTPAGRAFDVILLIVILYSIIIIMLESVEEYDTKYHTFFNISEWIVTILFTIEYIVRIICVKRPKGYILSFYGIIDFLSTIPKYLSFFIVGSQYFAAFRALRLLRVFRIFKLVRFLGESNNLIQAINASRAKIFVFVFSVLVISVILGTVMYLVEGPEHGFDSIPHSIYWTIVTLTTVGYGDITPQTSFGQFISAIIMIIGYGIIAVPTGIVTAEYTMAKGKLDEIDTGRTCESCGAEIHRSDADYCRKCGNKLPDA
ncbi:ion transporter [Aureibaculum marinum]|uniref:Ion transporter n=1 Tax=Aureibaculum marinum TaxID=2487930 RepID=A0A3N4NUC8_9FLAO|nr:ion transporter [Aureibaculum marinum]RPD90773.1 ion transporter [Aureibaculum marinum]